VEDINIYSVHERIDDYREQLLNNFRNKLRNARDIQWDHGNDGCEV
jgi:hypothetical protein